MKLDLQQVQLKNQLIQSTSNHSKNRNKSQNQGSSHNYKSQNSQQKQLLDKISYDKIELEIQQVKESFRLPTINNSKQNTYKPSKNINQKLNLSFTPQVILNINNQASETQTDQATDNYLTSSSLDHSHLGSNRIDYFQQKQELLNKQFQVDDQIKKQNKVKVQYYEQEVQKEILIQKQREIEQNVLEKAQLNHSSQKAKSKEPIHTRNIYNIKDNQSQNKSFQQEEPVVQQSNIFRTSFDSNPTPSHQFQSISQHITQDHQLSQQTNDFNINQQSQKKWKQDYVDLPQIKMVNQINEAEEKIIRQLPKRSNQSPRPEHRDPNQFIQDMREKRLKMFEILQVKYDNDFEVFKEMPPIMNELWNINKFITSQQVKDNPSTSSLFTPIEQFRRFSMRNQHSKNLIPLNPNIFERALVKKNLLRSTSIEEKESQSSGFGQNNQSIKVNKMLRESKQSNPIEKYEQIIQEEPQFVNQNEGNSNHKSIEITDQIKLSRNEIVVRAQTALRMSRGGTRFNKSLGRQRQGRNSTIINNIQTNNSTTIDESLLNSTYNTTSANTGFKKPNNLKMADYFKQDDTTSYTNPFDKSIPQSPLSKIQEKSEKQKQIAEVMKIIKDQQRKQSWNAKYTMYDDTLGQKYLAGSMNNSIANTESTLKQRSKSLSKENYNIANKTSILSLHKFSMLIFGSTNQFLLNQKNSIQDIIDQRVQAKLLGEIIQKVGGLGISQKSLNDKSASPTSLDRKRTLTLKKNSLSRDSSANSRMIGINNGGPINLEINEFIGIRQDTHETEEIIEDQFHGLNEFDESEWIEDKRQCEIEQQMTYDSMYKYGIRLDWSKCYLFQKCKGKHYAFNEKKNFKLFKREEIDETLQRIDDRQKDFKDFILLEPSYLKSINTLRELLFKELELTGLYLKYINRYGLVTLRNTQKLLLLCKKFFQLRDTFTTIFANIHKRSKVLRSLKAKIQLLDGPDIEETEDEDELTDAGTQIVQFTNSIINDIKLLRSHSTEFDVDFIIQDEDFVKLLKKECLEVRNLLFAFNIKLDQE
eukprot:403361969